MPASPRPDPPLPTSGLHHDVDEVAYHADGASLSSSSAKTLLYDGPAELARQRAEPKEYKPAFAFGSVVHALVLGVGDYAVLEEFDSFRTKEARAARDELIAKGVAPILPRDMAKAVAMRDSVFDHPRAAEMLSAGSPEVSMWATDPETGVLMRGRIDWLNNANIDVKSSGREVDQRNFMGAVWSFRYAFQAAWYERILALNGELGLPTRWIVVSKRPPHGTGVFMPDELLMKRARKDVFRVLYMYAHCSTADVWPELTAAYNIPGVGAPAIGSDIPWSESVIEC